MWGTIASIATILSLVLSLINLVWSAFLAREQLKVSQGLIELEMAKQLSDAKKYVDGWESMCFSYMDDTAKETAVLKKKDFVIEEALNCYETMCQKYCDSKVDKSRFKKAYSGEISNLFSRQSIFRESLDGESSKFKAIKKVYREWNDTE